VPGSEENLLWVITPEYSTERPLGPCQWSADHGASLPAPGAAVVVAFDAQGIPTVVWWEGSQTEPAPSAESITEAMLAKAVQEKLNASAWKTFTLGTKVEAGGLQSPRYRIEAGGSVVRLRGSLIVKSAQTIKASETLFTLPEGARPPGRVITLAAAEGNLGITAIWLEVSSVTGVAILAAYLTGTETGAGKAAAILDGVTFNLT
jgi:hypothetical protein